VTVGGDGDKQISFTSRADIARYISYVLTHLPAEQLNNRSFCIAGDNKVRPKRPLYILTAPDHGGTENSRSTRSSRDSRRKPGKKWKSLTSRFPNSMRDWPPTLTIFPPSCISSLRRRVLSRRPTITCTLTGTPPRCSTTSRFLEYAETEPIRSQNVLYVHCCERPTKDVAWKESILICRLEPVRP